jgi:hypothetical protein
MEGASHFHGQFSHGIIQRAENINAQFGNQREKCVLDKSGPKSSFFIRNSRREPALTLAVAASRQTAVDRIQNSGALLDAATPEQ